MRKGCYDPAARIDDMNVNGVFGSVNFPTFPTFAGATFINDPGELSLLATRAYNDWHLEDWCGTYPGRMIPLAVPPVWDPQLMADEVRDGRGGSTSDVMKQGFPHLRAPGASCISISAPQAVHPYPLQAHVNAAKAGADMLIRTLAMEWGPMGVRLNSIIPGPIADTEGMARLAPTPEAMAKSAKGTPLQRLGTKDEVADLALFLCSDAAAYITGAVIPCDGGLCLQGAGRVGGDR
jgi:hypothetical protein